MASLYGHVEHVTCCVNAQPYILCTTFCKTFWVETAFFGKFFGVSEG